MRSIGDAKDFAQYVKEVEAYINYEDAPTKLLDGLRERVTKSGLPSLATSERVYYAVSEFSAYLWNEGIAAYFEHETEPLFSAVAEGFEALGNPEWIEAYQRICAVDDWDLSADPMDFEYSAPFVNDTLSLDDAIDDYAIEQGLLEGVVS